MKEKIIWIGSVITLIVTLLGLISAFKPDWFMIHDKIPVFAKKINSTKSIYEFWDFSSKNKFKTTYLHLIIPLQSGLVEIVDNNTKKIYFNSINMAGTKNCINKINQGIFFCGDGREIDGIIERNWYTLVFNPVNHGSYTMHLSKNNIELVGYFEPGTISEVFTQMIEWEFNEVPIIKIKNPLSDTEIKEIKNNL